MGRGGTLSHPGGLARLADSPQPPDKAVRSRGRPPKGPRGRKPGNPGKRRYSMLNRHNLTIAKLASKEESRFALTRIRITPERSEVTNGHYAVTVTAPPFDAADFPERQGTPRALDHFEPFTIAADSALKAVKGHPAGKSASIPILATTAVGLTADGNPALVATDLEQVQVTEVRDGKDAAFPDFDRVFPAPDTVTFAMELDAAYLLALLQTIVDFKGRPKNGQRCPVTIRIHENGRRIFGLSASNDEGQQLRAVLMPINGAEGLENKWKEEQRAKREAAAEAGETPAVVAA